LQVNPVKEKQHLIFYMLFKCFLDYPDRITTDSIKRLIYQRVPMPKEPVSKHPFKIEICVEGIDGLVAAQQAGADRVELCASLLEGGLTPSMGVIREAMRIATIPFHVIVRPRGGLILLATINDLL
jgi:hypothetical protein